MSTIKALPLLLLLAGCSSLPVVTYDTYDPSAKISADNINSVPNTYELWTTSIEFKKDSAGAMTASIAAAPVSSGGTYLSITGESHWYKSTAVTLTTASDSNLLSSVSVNVTDNRASYITTAGEVLATILSVAGVAAAPALPQTTCDAAIPTPPSSAADIAAFPVKAFDEVVNLYDFMKPIDGKLNCSSSGKKIIFSVGNSHDGVGDLAVVTIDPPPASAIELTTANLAALKKSATGVFLYSACRNANVSYTGGGPVTKTDAAGKPATPTPTVQNVKFLFSDPRYVQAIPMPVKGSLTVKSQCGMTAGADTGTADSTSAIAKALADAIKGLPGKSSSASTPKTNASK